MSIEILADEQHEIPLATELFSGLGNVVIIAPGEAMLGQEKIPMPRLVVLGLDEKSGKIYLEELCKELGISMNNVDYRLINVDARVDPESLAHPERVANGVIKGILDYLDEAQAPISQTPFYKDPPIIFTLACNTVGTRKYQSLADRGLSSNDRHSLRHGEEYILRTPLAAVLNDALERERQNRKVPFFIGTTVSNEDVKWYLPVFVDDHVYYPGPEQKEMSDDEKAVALESIQAAIWLYKRINAPQDLKIPEYFRNLSQEAAENDLRNYTGYILDVLEKLGVDELYMGCTELPGIFAEYCPESKKEYNKRLKKIDPAHLVAREIKIILQEYFREQMKLQPK